ncbi:TPA: hypothetical protein QCR51_005841 [Bacillus cereus]|nr:hypothetical protein [Bacillus cereus]
MKLKVLSATGLALSIGLTSLGGITSTFAAETPKVEQSNEKLPFSRGFDANGNFTGWVSNDYNALQAGGVMSFTPYDISDLKVTSQKTKVKSIDFAQNDNTANSFPSTMNSMTKTFKHSDSMTIHAEAGFKIGAKVSAEASVPGLAKLTAEMSTETSFSGGVANVKGKEVTVGYGGEQMKADPFQLYRIDYLLEETEFDGEITTTREVTSIGNNMKFYTMTGDGSYYPGATEKYKNGVTGKQVYDFFKDLQSMANSYGVMIVKDGVGTASIRKGEFDKHYYFDDVNKKVYTQGKKAQFDGVTGNGLTAKPSVIGGKARSNIDLTPKLIHKF